MTHQPGRLVIPFSGKCISQMKGNLCRMKLVVVCRLHQLQDNLDQLLVVGHDWPMICLSPSNSPTGLGASPSFAKMACPNRSCRNSTHSDALNQPAFLSINAPSSQLALPTFLFILKFHFPHTHCCKKITAPPLRLGWRERRNGPRHTQPQARKLQPF